MQAGALGQVFHGGVRGKVRDTNDRVIPGVAVLASEIRTGVARRTETNRAGEYLFANLQPGTYELVAEREGFKTFFHGGLQVDVSQQQLLDITLEVGAVEESITVTEQAMLVDRATASVESTISRDEIESLPSPGRNVFILAVTTPNVVHTGNPVWVKQSDQTNSSLLALGGGPLRGNNYTVDGVSVTDLRNRAVVIPVFEAVQEMKVQTNTYDAEMGRTGGGVFNTLHRRGSNDWHGSSLYQFRPGHRNTFLRKLNYFEQQDFDAGRRETFAEAPFSLFGGSLGGPIKRSETFFWASAEGYVDKQVQTRSIHLPAREAAGGDFSGSSGTIHDPRARDGKGLRRPFPNNRLPATRLSPTGLELARLLSDLGPGGFRPASGQQTVKAMQSTANVSHAPSDRWRISGTYLYYTSSEPNFSYYRDLLKADAPPDYDLGASVLYRDTHAIAINQTFMPTIASVLSLRYGQTYFNDSRSSTAVSQESILGRLGIQGDFLDRIYGQDGYQGQFPRVEVAGFGLDGLTHGSTSNDRVVWSSREINGTYAQSIGNHTLKYGGQWRRLGLHAVGFGNGFGLSFARRFTQGPDPLRPQSGSGSGLADLLLGLPDGGTATLANPADVYLDYFGGFIQDDLRVGSRLVLNLGLRIEHETGLKENNDEFTVGWDRSQPFPRQPEVPAGLEGALPGFPLRGGLMYAGIDGNATHQWDPPALKVAPRLGFAYSLGASTVLRGGFAIFWAPYAIPSGTGASHVGTYGFTSVTSVPISVDGITPPEATASNPFPNGIDRPAGNTNGRFQNIGGDVYFNDQFRQAPAIHKWSLDLQRSIGRSTALKAGYLGSRGLNLPVGGTINSRININQLADGHLSLGPDLNRQYRNPFHGDPAFGSLAGEPTLPLGQLLRPFPHFRNVYARHVSSGRSLYHSLRLELEQRIRDRFHARINYTHTQHRDSVYEGNTLLQSVSGVTDSVYNSPDGCALGRCPGLESDYSHSNLHTPHQLNVNLIYALPGRRRWLGGWSASMATILRGGFPLSVTQNENPLGAYGFAYQRPQRVILEGGGDPRGRTSQYLTARGVEPTEALRLSDMPRTTVAVRSPSLVNWDVSFQKNTDISEDVRLILRLEFINIFNGINWNGPQTILGLQSFGSITGVRGYPRTFQLMTKLAF